VHDQGWQERPIFGKIRFMNYQGCSRKFDIGTYVRRIGELTGAAVRGGSGGTKGACGAASPRWFDWNVPVVFGGF
jgi:hypothetical protein